jgi:hypothetical protein
LIEQTESWVPWSEEALEAERMALRERLASASDSGKVTIVEWNTAWQKFTRSRDVYVTLATIQSTGNQATYHPVDVMDRDGMIAVGESLGRKITGLIHGAGLEDSKLVGQKDSSVFDKVVRVKIDGWQCMLAACGASGAEHPRFAACFTSVAGRFGNGGQTVFWMLKWLASPPQVCAGPLLLVGLAGATWVWRLVDRLKPSLQRQESTPSLSSKALKSSLVKLSLVESAE